MRMTSIATGAVIGLAVGAGIYAATNNMHYPNRRKRKMIKRRAEHAMNAVGSAVSDISQMMK